MLRKMVVTDSESIFLVSLALLCIGLPQFSISDYSETSVVKLNDANFSDKTKSQDWSLVLFYRNWCTRSKKVMKELDKAAEFMAKEESLTWAKVDCETDGSNTCEKFSVTNVPVLFLFRKGNYFKEFLDKPDYVGMVRFVKAETGPGYTTINNKEDMEIFFSGREAKVVGNFKSGSSLKKSFLGLVDELKHQFDFGLEGAAFVKDDEEITLHRAKHLQNKFEPSLIKYPGTDDVNELERWIIANKHGVVGHRHKYNADDFKEPLVVTYFDLNYEKASKVSHYWRNRVLKVAVNYPEYYFAISSTRDFQKEIVNFGYNFMRPSITPLVCTYINGKRYPMKDDFSVDTFNKYMEDLKSGKIEPHMRSEEPPESNDGPVKIAVAKNFDEIVSSSGKDALIKFYAPWCTWCKRLTPVWEELGKAMKNEDVVIVKFNAENNEIPRGYEVNGYPTLYWAANSTDKAPVLYQGGRDFEDFIKYIAEHATNELKGYDREGQSKTGSEEAKEQQKEEL